MNKSISIHLGLASAASITISAYPSFAYADPFEFVIGACQYYFTEADLDHIAWCQSATYNYVACNVRANNQYIYWITSCSSPGYYSASAGEWVTGC